VSATPLAEQNDGHGHIHADDVVPGAMDLLPTVFRGNVSLTQTSETTADLEMGSVTNGLSATITASQVGPNVVQIVEQGSTVGAFPETFAQFHNEYFDLKDAVKRNLR
jgi:hypothetical protein